jgi:hypothetical protein
MKISAVTSFSPKGYEQYGRRFIETYKEFWPSDIELFVYWEGERPDGVRSGHNLLDLEDAVAFIARHDNPIMRGEKPHPNKIWGRKAKIGGYNFRYDAFKFSRKVFAVAHAACQLQTGKLFWIDADVYTHRKMDKAFLKKILPENAALAYMARPNYHSELGFVGYNLNHPDAPPFIAEYVRQYVDDLFISHDRWDDCNIFDMLVGKLKPATKLIHHSSRAQPFDHSALARYMYHNKGGRK